MRIFFALGYAVVVALACTLLYKYNHPPRNIAVETGIPITATELYNQFISDEPQANQAYLNKVLQVSGQVLEVKSIPNSGKIIVLNTGDPMCRVACTLDHVETSAVQVKPGEKITIKGVCSGFISDVQLTNGYLIN